MVKYQNERDYPNAYKSKISLEQMIWKQDVSVLEVAAEHQAYPEGLRRMIRSALNQMRPKPRGEVAPPQKKANPQAPAHQMTVPADQLHEPNIERSLFKCLMVFKPQEGYEKGVQRTYYSKDYASERARFAETKELIYQLYQAEGNKAFLKANLGKPFHGYVKMVKFFNDLQAKGQLAKFMIYANTIRHPSATNGDPWPIEVFRWEAVQEETQPQTPN